MNRRTAIALATTLALGLLAASLRGCTAETAGGDAEAAAWVAEIEAAQADADQALARGDEEGARAALERGLGATVPPAVAAGHVRVVRQDLHYRLAEIALDAEQPADAERAASEGLALGVEEDLFTANLYIARGRAREALGREIEAAGDYHEALKINDTLLRRTLSSEEAP